MDFLSGALSLIFVATSTIIGVILISKYFRTSDKVYIFVGLTWILLVEPWYPSSLGLIYFLLYRRLLPDAVYLLVGTVLTPLGLFVWFCAFTDLVHIKKRSALLIAVALFGACYEAVFLSMWLIDPSLVGTVRGPVDVDYCLLINVYLIIVLVIVDASGIALSIVTIRSNDPETRVRGDLFLSAWLFFLVGSIVDLVSSQGGQPLILIARSILIVSAFLFYFSFNLPSWLKKATIIE